jgi:hypothetical protein
MTFFSGRTSITTTTFAVTIGFEFVDTAVMFRPTSTLAPYSPFFRTV